MTIKLRKNIMFRGFKDGMDATDLHRGYTFLTENKIFSKIFFYLLLIYRYIEVSNYEKLYMIIH